MIIQWPRRLMRLPSVGSVVVLSFISCWLTGAFRRYPGGTENVIILATISREMLKCRAASRWLMPSAQASRTFRYKSTVKILPPSLSPERVKVDDFYAARSRLIPPLPWPTFAPPFSADPVHALIRPEHSVAGGSNHRFQIYVRT